MGEIKPFVLYSLKQVCLTQLTLDVLDHMWVGGSQAGNTSGCILAPGWI